MSTQAVSYPNQRKSKSTLWAVNKLLNGAHEYRAHLSKVRIVRFFLSGPWICFSICIRSLRHAHLGLLCFLGQIGHVPSALGKVGSEHSKSETFNALRLAAHSKPKSIDSPQSFLNCSSLRNICDHNNLRYPPFVVNQSSKYFDGHTMQLVVSSVLYHRYSDYPMEKG